MEDINAVPKTSVVDFDSLGAFEQEFRNSETQQNDKLGPCEKKIRSMRNIPNWRLKLDEEHSFPQTLEDEVQRLLALKSYNIIGSEREPIFERITAFASRTFNVPIALVSLVDLGRQWFMSNRGLKDVRDTPRSEAFCGHTIYSVKDVFIVPDATKDPRFVHNTLVTGSPYIRFYAGSPMKTPEGHKIGTLCIIDDKPRPQGLSLMEKQNLMELSAMAMDALNNRKIDKERLHEARSKSIACTAHDLLTPLSGIQMNLSLLMEEKEIWKRMDEHQKELILSSIRCSDIIQSICQNEMESFRGTLRHTNEKATGAQSKNRNDGNGQTIRVSDLVRNLTAVIDKTSKHVPISMYVHENVPKFIISDGIKIFRSCLNYLTNACKHTKTGSILLRIFVTNKDGNKVNAKGDLYRPGDRVMFECIDTGPGIDVTKYQNLFQFWKDEDSPKETETQIETNNQYDMAHSGLGLQSVASNISSIGGEYGYRPSNSGLKLYQILKPSNSSETFLKLEESGSNEQLDRFDDAEESKAKNNGSIFWFSIPLVRPASDNVSKDRLFPSTLKSLKDSSKKRKTASSKESDDKMEVESLSSKTSKTSTISDNNVNKQIEPMIAAIEINKEEKEKAAMPPPRPLKPAHSDLTATSKRALVIDDSLTIRKSIDRALTKLGFHVLHARNGMEGLRELKNNLFAVTFCDFLMPIMDGLDCVKQYREWESAHRPFFKQFIIGISAHATDKDAERGMSVGMNKFISKPIKLNFLKEVVTSAEVVESISKLDACLGDKMDPNSFLQPYAADDSTTSSSKVEHSSGAVCLVSVSSRTICNALARTVESKGYRVCSAHNGEDTLRLLKVRNWDVVLVDEEIPQMGGATCVSCFREWETINRVARQNNIYILSGAFFSGVDVDHQIYPPGFDGALGKPVNLKNLYELLDRAADRKILDREILTR